MGNSLSAVAVGLNIWSVQPLGYTGTDPGFASLRVVENEIHVDADAWWASKAMVVNSPGGIHFETTMARAPVARLEIEDNKIFYDTFAGHEHDADVISAGIDLRADGIQLSRVDVLRNTVSNAPGPGILSSADLVSGQPSRFEGNTLVDCGRSPNLVGVNDDVERAGGAHHRAVAQPEPDEEHDHRGRDPGDDALWAGGRLVLPGELCHRRWPDFGAAEGCPALRHRMNANGPLIRTTRAIGLPTKWALLALADRDRWPERSNQQGARVANLVLPVQPANSLESRDPAPVPGQHGQRSWPSWPSWPAGCAARHMAARGRLRWADEMASSAPAP